MTEQGGRHTHTDRSADPRTTTLPMIARHNTAIRCERESKGRERKKNDRHMDLTLHMLFL